MKLEPRPVSSLEPRLQANVSARFVAHARMSGVCGTAPCMAYENFGSTFDSDRNRRPLQSGL